LTDILEAEFTGYLKMENKTIKLTLFLLLVTGICGALIGYVNGITAPIITEQAAQNLVNSYSTIYPNATEYEVAEDFEPTDVVTSKILAKENDEIKGVLYTVEGKGYGGTISILVGFDIESNTVSGIKILDQSETAGLGDNCKYDWFTNRYAGKDATTDLTVVKIETSSPNEVQAITAATRTSNGVTTAVNAARTLFEAEYK